MTQNDSSATAENLLSIAQYTTEIFLPGHRLSTINLQEVLSAYKHDIMKRKTRLKCVPVPDDVLLALAPVCVGDNPYVIDVDHCVVVGRKAAVILGVPVSGSCWAILHRCGCHRADESECSSNCLPKRFLGRRYVVQVISTGNVPASQMVTTEAMHCNIISSLPFSSTNTENSDLIVTVKRCETAVRRNGRREIKFVPKCAEKAVISRIRGPVDVSDDIITACLANYFDSPRHLHKGDITEISVEKYAPEAIYLSANCNFSSLFFIVKTIEGPEYEGVSDPDKSIGYLVVKGETTLLQSTDVQSFIPCRTASKQTPIKLVKSYEKCLLPLCPPGLAKFHDELLRSIIPFIHSNIKALCPAFLLIGPSGSGKHALVSSVAAYLGMHLWVMDCAEMHGITSGQTEGKLRAVFSKADTYAPCILLLTNIDILAKDQDGVEDMRTITEIQERMTAHRNSSFPVIFVATAASSSSLNGSLARIFLQEFIITAFGKDEVESQLKWFMTKHGAYALEKDISEIAPRSSGLLLADLEELVVQAVRNNFRERKIQKRMVSMDLKYTCLSKSDFEIALDKMQAAYAGAIGAPKIPSVKWSDVGGLGDLKEEILRTVTLPLKHPELVAAGLRRSGILLYGPPGTGKTLIAKAVATECNLNFLSVKGPELLNMYVGQSEENVREVFERARAASPCIVFFDELDSLAPNRGRSGDSGGVMDRVVSQLLAEMDGLQKSSHLFVIGATNRPDLIDPALLRPGRFDKLLYVGACEDQDTKMSVLKALTRKFILSNDINFNDLVGALPRQVTGADLYAACSGAWMTAVRRAIRSQENGNGKVPGPIKVAQSDFREAISKMVPSVSTDDMKYFKSLQQQLS